MFHVKRDGSVCDKHDDAREEHGPRPSQHFNAQIPSSQQREQHEQHQQHQQKLERRQSQTALQTIRSSASTTARRTVNAALHAAANLRSSDWSDSASWSLKLRFAAWLELGRTRIKRQQQQWMLQTEQRTLVLPRKTADVSIAALRRELSGAIERTPRTATSRDEALATAVPVPLPAHRVEVLGGARRCAKEPAANLFVGFLADTNDPDSWITHADIARWNLSVDELYDATVENLWRATQGAVVLQEDVSGREIYHIRHGDGLDSSRLLLSKLWAQVSDTCGESLILCAPTRGKIYAAPADQPSSIERLATQASGDWATGTDRVSPALWIWQEGALHRWTAHA